MKTRIKIEQSVNRMRLDSFLAQKKSITRSIARKEIESSLVLVNNKATKPSYILKVNDIVEFEEENFLGNIEILPQNDLKVKICYEDENMLVVNKPKEMLTHPTTHQRENTLVNFLLAKYGKDNLSDVNGIFRPGIVHRLDKNTSGLLMIAKNNDCHRYLCGIIKDKTAIRKYIAIVEGRLEYDFGTINLPIGRDKKHSERMSIDKDGKPSITEYRVLERFEKFTFIELILKTGRTHQIRVHLSNLNHPIVNDSLYGAKKLKVKTQQQVLQSYSLTFLPFQKKQKITLQIDYDDDIKKVLRYLRSKQ